MQQRLARSHLAARIAVTLTMAMAAAARGFAIPELSVLTLSRLRKTHPLRWYLKHMVTTAQRECSNNAAGNDDRMGLEGNPSAVCALQDASGTPLLEILRIPTDRSSAYHAFSWQ